MDLTPYLGVIKFIHVAGAFLFVAGHGVSMLVAFRIRQERDAGRLLALLDLSRTALNLAGIGLLVLLVSGIVSGIAGNYFGHIWIWASLVLLVVIGGLMTPLAAIPMANLRLALGQPRRGAKPEEPAPVPLPLDEVIAMTNTRRPEELVALGGLGFLVILGLMIFKPF